MISAVFIGAKCTYGNIHTGVITSSRPKDWTYVFSNFPADRLRSKGRAWLNDSLSLLSLYYPLSYVWRAHISLLSTLSLPPGRPSRLRTEVDRSFDHRRGIRGVIRRKGRGVGGRAGPAMRGGDGESFPRGKSEGKNSYRMKYFTGPIANLDVFRLIGRCTASADAKTSILFRTPVALQPSPRVISLALASFIFVRDGSTKTNPSIPVCISHRRTILGNRVSSRCVNAIATI